jgi:4-diphosphocytidyl-2-C-methyl-D-erythritol kinase
VTTRPLAARGWTLPAPAKLNLFLHVIGRRADGYHRLESLVVPIDFGDSIGVALRADDRIVRIHGPDDIAADDDLAVRAARLLQRSFGVGVGADISVIKRIPVGSGLGGGSSDAATVLLGLSKLWRLELKRSELMRLALELGADVPFFVFGQPALARGIGEILEPVTIAPSWFLVMTPAVHVSTAAIFAAPELTRSSESARMSVFSEGYGRNDLQRVAAARFPQIAGCLEALGRDGAARMTGSGACVFAAFGGEESAQRALSRLPRGTSGFVARALDRHPLRDFATP